MSPACIDNNFFFLKISLFFFLFFSPFLFAFEPLCFILHRYFPFCTFFSFLSFEPRNQELVLSQQQLSERAGILTFSVMSTFLPSPTRASQGQQDRRGSKATDASHRRRSDATADFSAFAMPMVVMTQNAWRDEARRCSIETGDNASSPRRNSKNHSNKAQIHTDPVSGHQGCEDPEELARKFEDWLTVVETNEGQLGTVQQTDLCLWFHEERLAAKTPFAAVVPCPASLQTDKARRHVMNAIDNFAFPVFYVQTLPMGAKLSEVAQAFVRSPAHLPESRRYDAKEGAGRYGYTTVACRTAADAMELVDRFAPLQDAVRDVPCLLLNDFCPLTPLCLRCLVVAGRCVAAEVVCDEAYTPLFGIRPNDGGEAGSRNGFDDMSFIEEQEPHATVGERRRASAAARRRDSGAAAATDGMADYRTASDVVAFGLKRFVEETLGASLGGRSYTALVAAEVKGFDPRVLGPRDSDPPFWPVMTKEPLHQRPSPFDEAGLRFYALSFDYADPAPFEAFSAQELHAVGDYVVEREADGATLPPILRFLDGHEAERAAAHPPPAWKDSAPSAPSSHSETSSIAPSSHKREAKKEKESHPHHSSRAKPASSRSSHSHVDDTSSSVPSSYRSSRAADAHTDESAKNRPKSETAAPLKEHRRSAKTNQPQSPPVATAPVVLEPQEADSRGNGTAAAPVGRRVDPADVDDVSSNVSSETRTSSRLPTRTSSFNRPAPVAGNGATAERPTGARTESTASVPSSYTVLRNGGASVDRSETASTASTHASRLPERRASTAHSGGVASGSRSSSRRSSAARGDDFVTETESVRSSLPARRRSSAYVPAGAVAPPPVVAAANAPASESSTSQHTSVASTQHDAAPVEAVSSRTSSRPSGGPRGSTATPSVQSAVEEIVTADTVPSSQMEAETPATPTATHRSETGSTRSSRTSRAGRDEKERAAPSVSVHGNDDDGVASSECPATEREVTPPRSAASSMAPSVVMSSAHSRRSVPKVAASANGSSRKETPVASEAASTRTSEAASRRTASSAAPVQRAPESLLYDDAEETTSSHHNGVVKKGADSAYSSTYVSTRSAPSGVRLCDIPTIRKEDIPYICSPREASALDENSTSSAVSASREPSVRSSAAASERASTRASTTHSKTPASSAPPQYTRFSHEASVVSTAGVPEKVASLSDAPAGEEGKEEVASVAESAATSSSAKPQSHSQSRKTPASYRSQQTPSLRSSRPATTAASSHRSAAPSSSSHKNGPAESSAAVPAVTDVAPASQSPSVVSSAAPSARPTPARQTTEAITAATAHVLEESEVPSVVTSALSAQELEDLAATSSVSQPHSVASSSAPRKTPSHRSDAGKAAERSAVPSINDSQSTRSSRQVADGKENDVPTAASSERPATASVRSSRHTASQRPHESGAAAPSERSSVRSAAAAAAKPSSDGHAAAPSTKENGSVASTTQRTKASVTTPASSRASERCSEVPDAAEFLAGADGSEPAVAPPTAAAAAEVTTRCSHSSSSASSSYSNRNSTVERGQPAASTSPKSDRVSRSAKATSERSTAASLKQVQETEEVPQPQHDEAQPAEAAETAVEEIDTAMSETSRGGSQHFADDEEQAEAEVEEKECEPEEQKEKEQDVDVDARATASETAAAAAEEVEEEESLVASAHSIFDAAGEPAEAVKETASSCTSGSASGMQAADAVEEPTEAAADASVEDEGEEPEPAELQSTGYTSCTDAASGFYPVNSADLHSCVSASVVSSRSTAMRRWASGPASEANDAASLASRGGYLPTVTAAAVAPPASSAEAEAARAPSARSSQSSRSVPRGAASGVMPTTSAASRTPDQSAPSSLRLEAERLLNDTASETASSNGQHDASTGTANGVDETAVPAAAETASVASENAHETCSATAGAAAADRDAALRKARLRAIAALIVANAAYEEVQRVAAMYGQA